MFVTFIKPCELFIFGLQVTRIDKQLMKARGHNRNVVIKTTKKTID